MIIKSAGAHFWQHNSALAGLKLCFRMSLGDSRWWSHIDIARLHIFCEHNSFLSHSQLFQISQIFENVFRKLSDSVVLQPSDKKNNTAMIGEFFHIFQVLWVFQTNFRNRILVNILTFLKLISDSFDKSGSYYFVKLLEHPYCALFCSFIQQTYTNSGIKLWSLTTTFFPFFLSSLLFFPPSICRCPICHTNNFTYFHFVFWKFSFLYSQACQCS